MKSAGETKLLSKSILSGAITAALSVCLTPVSQADIYEFSFDNGGCDIDHSADSPDGMGGIDHSGDIAIACTGPGDAIFTMLDPGGVGLQNTSKPYYYDAAWGYGFRTQMQGKLSFDDLNRTGSVSIGAFEFFSGGAATASGITMKEVSGGPNGLLWLSNMDFNWNSSDIVTQVVWDAKGLFDSFPFAISEPADIAGVAPITGVGVLPASDGIKKNNYPIGVAPIATSTFNTAGQAGVGTVLADLSLGADDGFGGSPMDNGPFSGFNANFDFSTLTLSGYNDTTAPVASLDQPSITINEGDLFDPTNPTGVTVTCTDAKDGVDTIAAAANANISFPAPVSDVNTGVAGSYTVTYTCTDNASRWAGVQDPTDSSATTIPVDNVSASVDLGVTVAAVGQPVITVNPPLSSTHEACTLYTDAGATAVDAGGSPISPVIVTDNDSIIGNSSNELAAPATIDYDISDGGVDATTQTRTVTIDDRDGPVFTLPADFTIESTDPTTKPVVPALDANGDCNPVVGDEATAPETINKVVPVGLDSVLTVLNYSATDSSFAPPNTTTDQLRVTVERSEPVITLIGGGVVLGVGTPYVEDGMDIHDVQDGDLTSVTTSGTTAGVGAGMGDLTHVVTIRDAGGAIVPSIDTSAPTSYTVEYDATDSNGNLAAQVIRSVTVGGFASDSNFTMLNSEGTVIGGTNDVFFDWDGSSVSTDEEDTSQFTDPSIAMSIVSVKPQPFFSFVWDAHHIRTFGPGTYSFDTTCTVAQLEAGMGSTTNPCDGPLDAGQTQQFMTMTVAAGQIGAHILFDWNTSSDIDVLNVWDQVTGVWNRHGGTGGTNKLWDGPEGLPPLETTTWLLVSTDIDGDAVNASPMVDGPFQGFNANFNAGPADTDEPPLPYVGSAPDTDIGGGGLASLNVWGILAGLVSLLGFRRFNNKR